MKRGNVYKMIATTALAGQVMLIPFAAYADQIPLNTGSVGVHTVRAVADELDLNKESEKDVKSWEDTEYKRVENSLSSAEKNVLREYTKNIDEMNRYAKEHIYAYDYEQDEQFNKSIKEVEKILMKASLPRPMAVYRAETPETFGFSGDLYQADHPSTISIEAANKLEEQIVNQTFRVDGYTPNALTSGKNGQNPIILCLHAPAGTHAMLYKPEESADMSVLLKDGYSIQPEKVTIITQQGKEYLKVDATVVETVDFKDDTAKATEWGKQQYDAWGNHLTESQKEDLNGYMRQDYKEINKYLWEQGPEKNPNPALDEKIQSLEDSLSMQPIPENITAYRRMGAAEFGMDLTDPAYKFENPENVKAFQDKWEGQIKDNPGFLSTSLSSTKEAAFAPRKFVLRLNVLKGTEGAYVSVLEGYQNEREVLLNKGYSYKINKITPFIDKGTTRLLIDATIIPK